MTRYGIGMLTKVALVMVLCFTLAPIADAQVFVRKKDGTVMKGDNVKASTRGLMLQAGARTVTIKFADIDRVQSPAPPNLKALLMLTGRGQYEQAIPGLKKVVDEYVRQEHDLKAGAALIKAYSETGKGSTAVNVYRNLLKLYGEERMDLGTTVQYWDALIGSENFSAAQKDIDKVLAGNADILKKGAAAVKMGDVLAGQGRYEEALTDGYLKAIYMFGQARAVQPKAYEGAYNMLNNLRDGRKEKIRKQLISKYPTSEEARNLK